MSILMGEIVANLNAKQPDAQAIISDFKKCLKDYREHAEAWYGGILDAEQQFKVGDEVGTADKDSKKENTLYANCPANGKLVLVHSFESARFVPIGNTPVRLTPVVDGRFVGKTKWDRRSTKPSMRPASSKSQALHRTNNTRSPSSPTLRLPRSIVCSTPIRGNRRTWRLVTDGVEHQFPAALASAHGCLAGRACPARTGSRVGRFSESDHGFVGRYQSLYDLVAHPRENYEKLKNFFTEEQIKKIYDASAEAIHTALLIASDEPLMWIYVAAIVAWVKMLPPQTCTEVLAQMSTEFLLNILVGVVLTGGLGLAVRVGTKAIKGVQASGKVVKLIEDFTGMLMKVSKSKATPHTEAITDCP